MDDSTQFVDPDQQKAIEAALIEKYQQAADPSAVQNAVKSEQSKNLIAGIGQALETAARAQSMSRGGAGVDPSIYNSIRQQGQQGVQNATAQRQMAVDAAMKNIEMNRQGVQDTMGIQSHNQSMTKGNQDLQKGELELEKGQKDLALQDQQAAINSQRIKSGKIDLTNLGNNQDPKSNVSQLKQDIATKLVPGKDFTNFSGSDLDATIPQLKDMFDKQVQVQIEQIKSNPAIAGNKASDEAFAKDYVDYVANGGAAAVKQNLSKVQEVSDSLAKPGNSLTGTIGSAIADKFGVKAFVNPDAVATEQKLRAAVLPTLKSIFPRLTEVEVNEAINTAYNSKLSPAVNKANVDKFLERLKSEADAKQAAAQYFQDHKTLNGFKGDIPGSAELSGPTAPAQGSSSPAVDTGYGHLSDQELQDRIKALQNGSK